MANNGFANNRFSKAFSDVKKANAEKATVVTVKMIPSSKLHNYPFNHEDITDTKDLENSIRQIGFIDPIEVTTDTIFETLKNEKVSLMAELQELQVAELSKENQARSENIKSTINRIDVCLAELGSNGERLIVSGHRRRFAGDKVGLDLYPCIIKEFNSIIEIENYVLLANSQRDSAKDPLLFCKRYKQHSDYLKSIGFDGNFRDEIAKRLGISIRHADRFNAMNKVISPVWEMIQNETVGMSSVLPMASHSEEEQFAIYYLLQDALNNDITLTRETVKKIIDGFRNGKRSWSAIKASMSSPAPEPTESKNTPSNKTKESSFEPQVKETPGYNSYNTAFDDSDEYLQHKNYTAGNYDEDDFEYETTLFDGEEPLYSDESKPYFDEDINTAFTAPDQLSEEQKAKETIMEMGLSVISMIDTMTKTAKKHNLIELLDESFNDIIESIKQRTSK